jgi:flagellar hook assembly protein FlgD
VGAEIFDAQGRQVRALGPQRLTAGSWMFEWDGRDGHGELAPTGVYFYRLEVEGREAADGKLVRIN